jgi:uncharacterized protein YfcZ (UPF0381/DUF406 family)
VLEALLKSAHKSKEELTAKVSSEIIKIVSKIDFVKEASKFVEDHKFSVRAEIDVVKKTDGKSEMKVDFKFTSKT